MQVQERRQHFRIEDRLYFNYRIMDPGEIYSDQAVIDELLGKNGQRYLEASHYFQNIDYELAELSQAISLKDPNMAHYLNLLNAKVDYLSRQMLMTNTLQLRKVDLSLGGMSFKTPEALKESSHLKMVIYTKPQMIPLILEATVVYSQYQTAKIYRTAVSFNHLTAQQEHILSQHILTGELKTPTDS